MGLYHRTCNHGQKGMHLGEHRLMPIADRLGDTTSKQFFEHKLDEQRWQLHVVWATDDDALDAERLGLSRFTCDRMEHRFRILDEKAFQPLTGFLRQAPRPAREWAEQMAAQGGQLGSWLVATSAVLVEYSPAGALYLP